MDLSTINTTELRKLKAKLKGVLAGISMLGAICLVILYILKANPGAFIPVFLLPLTFLPAIARLKAVQQILKSRTATENQ
jgi:hypothetical protein